VTDDGMLVVVVAVVACVVQTMQLWHNIMVTMPNKGDAVPDKGLEDRQIDDPTVILTSCRIPRGILRYHPEGRMRRKKKL